jgi:hypothetical protein
MKKITGHIDGLYNLIADYAIDTQLLFSDFLHINKKDIDVKLRRTDISAQIIVHSEDIKKKCDTKIIFVVNRLDEYETFEDINEVLYSLSNMIKIKDRSKKLYKIQSKIL